MEALIPNIMVQNVQNTLDFYCDLLNFEVIDTNTTSGLLDWAFVQRDAVGLMFQEEKSLKAEYPIFNNNPIGGALTFYIRVQNIHTLFAPIQGKSWMLKPLHTTSYGILEFAMKDINGHVLTFSETPKTPARF